MSGRMMAALGSEHALSGLFCNGGMDRFKQAGAVTLEDRLMWYRPAMGEWAVPSGVTLIDLPQSQM